MSALTINISDSLSKSNNNNNKEKMLRQAVWALTKNAALLTPRFSMLQCLAFRRFADEINGNGGKKPEPDPETEEIKKILVAKIKQV